MPGGLMPQEVSVFILHGILNDAVLISKDLRHNWLGHEVLPFEDEYIAMIYVEDSPSRDRFAERIRPGGTFEHYIGKAKALSAIVVQGFSPAQLVDDGPLLALSDEGRALIRSLLHDEYLKQTGIESLSLSLQAAVSDLFERYKHFVKHWYSEPRAAQEEIKESFGDFQRSAKVFDEVLESLPKGVVLP
jgi:hypothetical protein